MTKENNVATQPQQKIEARADRTGVIPGTVHLALDVVDRGQSLALTVINDARAELRAVADGAIELAEKTTAAGFRFAKKLAARLDEAAQETIGNAEKLVGSAVKSARDTTKAAIDLAQVAGQGIAGERATA